MENTDLSNARLSPGNSEKCIDDADLSRANLTKSQLSGARLLHVNLAHANFEDANLEGTQLLGVDLRDVKGLTEEQLEKSCGEEVQLPEGWSISPCNPDAKKALSIVKLMIQAGDLSICDG